MSIWRRGPIAAAAGALAAAAGVLAVACSAAPSESDTAATAQESGLTTADTADLSGLITILATPDIAVGTHRFAFVLTDKKGLIRLPVAAVASYRYPDGHQSRDTRQGPVQQARARFTEFPLGTRGIYVVDFEFDRSGEWGVEVSVPTPEGSSASTEILFSVPDRTRSPSPGERPPASQSRTLADVASIEELATGTHHDPELYRLSIADALAAGRPMVVVFASPAFCTNAVCGPQVEVESELREQYGDRVNFIHVDLYENPLEIQGDLDRGILTPILEEWGLTSQEWTFVMDGDGIVRDRFENFVPAAELERSIQSVLD